MNLPLTPIDEPSPQLRVTKSIRAWIDQRLLQRNDPLPSARRLSDILGVNRRTVMKGLELLIEEGLIAKRDARTNIVAGESSPISPLMANTVAVFCNIDSPDGAAAVEDQGWSQFISIGALRGLQSAGLHGINISKKGLTAEQIRAVVSSYPKGIIVTDIAADQFGDLYEPAMAAGIPLVVMGEEHPECDSAAPDHFAGARELVHWLAAQGHERVVWSSVSPVDSCRWMASRFAGFRQGLEDAGLELLEPIIAAAPIGRSSEKKWWENAARMYSGFLYEAIAGDDPADAIVALNDVDFFFIAYACRMFGKVPNEDVAIVGYDNCWESAFERAWEPAVPLATYDKENFKVGEALVDLLLARLNGELPPEPQHVAVPGRLVIPDQPGRTKESTDA